MFDPARLNSCGERKLQLNNKNKGLYRAGSFKYILIGDDLIPQPPNRSLNDIRGPGLISRPFFLRF